MNPNPADIGGQAAGPIDTIDHGMKFWEKQANALRSTLTSPMMAPASEPRLESTPPRETIRPLSIEPPMNVTTPPRMPDPKTMMMGMSIVITGLRTRGLTAPG